jgi:hypothetical protein
MCSPIFKRISEEPEMKLQSLRKCAKLIFFASFAATSFSLILEVFVMMSGDGTPLELFVDIGMISSAILVLSIVALHALSKKFCDQEVSKL